MIKDFPTSDPLHLLEQGIMKRMLKIWMKSEGAKYKNKWSEANKGEINKAIIIHNRELPSDIHRKLRSLDYIAHFKANQFRGRNLQCI